MIETVRGHKTVLLHGVTGSGKTEVYLHAAQAMLARGRQVLLLVPEINLTPQLERSLRARLAPLAGADGLAVLHSGLSDGERLRAWLAALRGQARILLGTRLAIFTPMPDLGLIVVDEEHDASYKQQEGLRYSARDLAVWRGHDAGLPVVLGSATPSLESWHHAQRGHYLLATLAHRAHPVEPPRIRLVDTRRPRARAGVFAPARRCPGAAPGCGPAIAHLPEPSRLRALYSTAALAAGSVSVPRCTAYAVLHRRDARRHYLQCHHCGHQMPVPHACPDCGDQDLQAMGRGTQRIEERLADLFPSARVARIDADSTRLKGSAERLFARIHAGEVDIMVGTQMVSKGHDFANLGLVGVLNADVMLFAQDFRAPERLFAQLMQVAGRAGRHAQGAEVIIQTGYPEQPIYQALMRHDYSGFARYSLSEREAIGLPPYAYQALLTAEASELATALDFLGRAKVCLMGFLSAPMRARSCFMTLCRYAWCGSPISSAPIAGGKPPPAGVAGIPCRLVARAARPCRRDARALAARSRPAGNIVSRHPNSCTGPNQTGH